MTAAADSNDISSLPQADQDAIGSATLISLMTGFRERATLEKLVGIYTSDTDWVNAFGTAKRGGDEIVKYLRGLFSDHQTETPGRLKAPPRDRAASSHAGRGPGVRTPADRGANARGWWGDRGEGRLLPFGSCNAKATGRGSWSRRCTTTPTGNKRTKDIPNQGTPDWERGGAPYRLRRVGVPRVQHMRASRGTPGGVRRLQTPSSRNRGSSLVRPGSQEHRVLCR